MNLNRGDSPSYPAASATLPPVEETHARVYDVPPVVTTGSQPFTVPGGPQPQYSQPGNVQYGVTSNNALLALILGIASFFGLSLFGAIPAIVLGRNAQQEIRASGGRVTGDGMAQAGIVLGWINVALSVLLFCFVCMFFTAIGTSFSP